MKKVTIKDIAKHAGVSTASVSYVVNGKKGKVSEETRIRVEDSINALGYRPNISARTLVAKQSKLIGLIMPQMQANDQLMLKNPFYSDIISSIELYARSHGYNIMLSGVSDGESYVDIFMKRNIDGAIVLGVYEESFYERLKEIDIPVVLIDSYVSDDYYYCVNLDDRLGGYKATSHLIDKGHRDIALVTGEILEEGVIAERLRGYKEALRDNDISFKDKYVFAKHVSYEYGIEIGRHIGKDCPEITAIFATADMMALGVIKGLAEAGKGVPKDVSVIGFDDIYLSQMITPALTTIKQDIDKKGSLATDILIDLIEGKSKPKDRMQILGVELVERET